MTRWEHYRKLRFVLGLTLLSLAVGVIHLGCQGASPASRSTRATAAETPLVKVYTVKRAATDVPATYSGDVRATEQVRLVPKLGGRLEELRVGVGDVVKAGTIVAVVDHAALDAGVRQAEGGLAAAKARLDGMEAGPKPESIAVAEAGLRVAQKNVESAKNALWAVQNDRDGVCSLADSSSRPAGWNPAIPSYNCDSYNARVAQGGSAVEVALASEALTQRQLELARAIYSETDLAAARAQVEQAQAALDLARAQRAEAFIRAPLSGVVSERLVSVGATVGPAAPILTIVSSQLKVDLAIEEGQLPRFRVGLPVSLTVAAYPGVVYTGTVSRLAPAADERTRSFAVEVTPSDVDGQLRAGMFATISIEGGPRPMRIPLAAVVETDGSASAFAVEASKAVSRPLILGQRSASEVDVVRGLAYGEQVIMNPPPGLKTGDTVQVDVGS